MISVPTLNGALFSMMLGNDDSGAVVKTLTDASQNVFDDVLENDEIVEFWAEEDFSYSISADPTAATATSHRVKENTIKMLIIPKGTNIAIIGTADDKKFYLSK
jgi:hypothetical protein